MWRNNKNNFYSNLLIIQLNYMFVNLKKKQDAYHYNNTGVRVIVVCPGLLHQDGNSSAFGNRFKSPSHEKAWQLDMKGVHPQRYFCFLSSLVSIKCSTQYLEIYINI